MKQPKTHRVGTLTAYYTKKGRTWWVEQGDKREAFKSIEEMVDKYPKLLKAEPIKMSVERRAFSKTGITPVALHVAGKTDDFLTKIVTCYYCGGSGTVAFMPCPNCGGIGRITLTTRGL